MKTVQQSIRTVSRMEVNYWHGLYVMASVHCIRQTIMWAVGFGEGGGDSLGVLESRAWNSAGVVGIVGIVGCTVALMG